MSLVLLVGAADPPVAERILVAHIFTQGLEPERADTITDHIIAQLQAQGADAVRTDGADRIIRECLEKPTCLQEAATHRGASALLDVSLIRFGPMVRTDLRFFDGQTGTEILAISATVPVETIAESPLLAENVTSGVEAIRQRRRSAEETPTEPRTAVAPGPTIADGAVQETSGTVSRPPVGREVDATAIDPAASREEAEAEEEAGGFPWLLVGTGSAALGAALLVAGGISGTTAFLENQEIQEQCPGGECDDNLRGRVDSMKTLALVADLLLGAGAISGVAGATMAVLGLVGVGEDEPEQ